MSAWTGRRPSKARVLGTCEICGRKVFGRRTVTEEQARHIEAAAVRMEGGGIRHGKCHPAPPGFGKILDA